MKIKINTANDEKIHAELDKINGKAKAFTICTAKAVHDIAKVAEAKLAMLPKADRKGAVADYCPAGPAANSYKYAAKSTRVYIERGTSDWFLTGVFSAEVRPKHREKMNIKITPAQVAEIQRRALLSFISA